MIRLCVAFLALVTVLMTPNVHAQEVEFAKEKYAACARLFHAKVIGAVRDTFPVQRNALLQDMTAKGWCWVIPRDSVPVTVVEGPDDGFVRIKLANDPRDGDAPLLWVHENAIYGRSPRQ